MRNFNNIEMWAVVKFCILQGKAEKEIQAILAETLGKHGPSYATVKNWAAQLKHGEFFTCDAPHPVWLKTVNILEIIDQILELILEELQPNFS
jgi:hypothetical protein